MRFSEELNNYLKVLNCSAQDLSKKSGLSPTLISRYLNDKRTPRIGSEYFYKIVDGIYEISIDNKVNFDKEQISDTLNKSLSFSEINFDDFIYNFNLLITELNINISDIASSVGYDTSFISKVRNKTRKPSDLNDFSKKVAEYVAKNCQDTKQKGLVSSLIHCTLDEAYSTNKYSELIEKWLISHQEDHSNLVKNFLTKLDSFDLNDYIGTDFEKVKVPTSPIILKNSRTYFGIDGRKKAESEFLKTTLLSKSKDPIFFFNNLPISEAGKDEKFKNKWVLAVTMVLKKGLHLNMVHTIDRPIDEMLLGLENWIPIYMTGSISPYYFKEPPSNMFYESLYVSGSCSLVGDCLKSSPETSRFYFTTKSDEVDFFKEKSSEMLSNAKPLMTIYKEKDKSKFEEFIKSEKKSNIKKIENDSFKNIDFYICKNKWVSINKKTSPEMHFVIHNYKLRNAIESFLRK